MRFDREDLGLASCSRRFEAPGLFSSAPQLSGSAVDQQPEGMDIQLEIGWSSPGHTQTYIFIQDIQAAYTHAQIHVYVDNLTHKVLVICKSGVSFYRQACLCTHRHHEHRRESVCPANGSSRLAPFCSSHAPRCSRSPGLGRSCWAGKGSR